MKTEESNPCQRSRAHKHSPSSSAIPFRHNSIGCHVYLGRIAMCAQSIAIFEPISSTVSSGGLPLYVDGAFSAAKNK